MASGWRTLSPACPRSVRAQLDGAAGRGHGRLERDRRGAPPARPSASAVRWTLSGAAGSSARRPGCRRSRRSGRAGSGPSPGRARRARRGAWRRPPHDRPARRPRENRRRERRRYQVDRSSIVLVDRPRRRLGRRSRAAGPRPAPRAPASRDRIQRSSAGAPAAAGGEPVRRRPAGQPGVGHEERVDVPQDEQPAGAPRRRRASRTGCCRRAGRAYIQRITSTPIRSAASSNSIALPQLLCIGRPSSPNKSRVAEDRPERRLAAEHGRHREHRVEPVAELAGEALGDEVGREPLRPVLGVLAEVEGRERHDAGVEPRVADVGDARDRLAAAGQAILTASTYGRCGRVALERVPALDRPLARAPRGRR